MAKAVPGAPYVVVQGDNLSAIAKQAYGIGSKWKIIWTANKAVLRSGDPNLIYPGEVLQIPVDPDVAKYQAEKLSARGDEYLAGKERDSVTLLIDGVEVRPLSLRLLRSMDTCASGYAATIDYDSDPVVRDLVRPYGYEPCKLYLGPFLRMTGRLYGLKPKFTESELLADIEGASPTVDIVDSSCMPPFERRKITLKKRAEELIEPLGISLVYDAPEGEQFAKITAQPEEKIFDHLAGLAKQRSVLITSNIHGELVFYQSQVGKPVGVLKEESIPLQGCDTEFNGRERWNAYRVSCHTPKRGGRNKLYASAVDPRVPSSRRIAINVDDSTAGNIQAAAEWQRSKQIADALTLEVPVSSWYSPNDELWRENTIVTLKAPSLYVAQGFDFMIRSVEYTFDANGATAKLGLIPPQTYTGEPIEEPWA